MNSWSINSIFSVAFFGASDDVLGSIESGVDFERRVLDIYQECRTEDEIQSAFAALQKELEKSIQTKLKDTRKVLLEHFDEDVHERLKGNLIGTQEKLDRIGKQFWTVTKHVLSEHATFNDSKLSFNLHKPLRGGTRLGTYHLVTKNKDVQNSEFLYRLSHPLGEHVIQNRQGVILSRLNGRVLISPIIRRRFRSLKASKENQAGLHLTS